jgi:hypothetical protein
VPDPVSAGFSPAEEAAWYALDEYLPLIISTRVAAALSGRDTGTTAYLPWTEP